MLIEAVQFVGFAAAAIVLLATLKVVLDLFRSGEGRVREIRQEGGGVRQRLAGELALPARKPTSSRVHGLHIGVARNGDFIFREKSAISRDVA